jgi:hypothetical protein
MLTNIIKWIGVVPGSLLVIAAILVGLLSARRTSLSDRPRRQPGVWELLARLIHRGVTGTFEECFRN